MSDDIYQYVMLGIIIAEVVLASIFLVLYFIRICKLDQLASTDLQKKPKALYFKVYLILFLIIFYLLHILLSFLDPKYWLYGPQTQYFSFVEFINVICCLLQIYILRVQHLKQAILTRLLPLQWALDIIFCIAQIVVTLVINPTYTVAIPAFILLDLFGLIGVVLWFKQLNPVSNLEFIANQTLIPLVPIFPNTSMDDRIYIQFNKQFQITIKNSKATSCIFKFAVYIGYNFTVLSKTQFSFADLQRDMVQQFPQDKYLLTNNIIHKLRSFQGTSLMKYGQQKQKICEDYLAYITSQKKYYIQILMDFLEIPIDRRNSLINRKRSKMKKNSIHSNNTSNNISSSNNSSDPSEREIGQPIFKVFFHEGYFFLENKEILETKIDKNYLEIRQFHNQLIGLRKLKTPIIVSEQNDVTEMTNFLFRCVNFKQLWKYFAEWMGLGVQLQNRVYNMFQFWNYGFYHLNISIIGHEVDLDENGQIHALYLISISTKSDRQILNKKIKKRNTDFNKLHKALQKHFARQQIKKNLPALPPKLTFFGSKTSTKSRQIYFDHYIKQLFKTPKLNHSVKFLNFLQMDEEYPYDFLPPKAGLASAENSMLEEFLNNMENVKYRQQRSQG